MPPDNSAGEFGFDFTRFGVRVPAVIVSPWIAEGTVFRPSGSTLSTTLRSFKTVETRQAPPLTARDAAAPSLGEVLTLAAARTDDPLSAVTVPQSRGLTRLRAHRTSSRCTLNWYPSYLWTMLRDAPTLACPR